MYRIAICDDNKQYLDLTKSRLERYCKENDIKIVLDCFQNSGYLAERIEKGNLHDAYILDIEMPDISGLELSGKIREYSDNSYIIFLTAHTSYAVKGYGVNVLGYVLKEHLEEDMPEVLDRLFAQFQRISTDRQYVIHNQRKYIRVRQDDIIYIYKKQKNVCFVLRGKCEEWERNTLQEVYEKLDHASMFLLDRGVIINLEHICRIVEDCVEMVEGHRIYSSKGHILELKEFLT